MAYYEEVADAARIAQSRMGLLYEALHDKAKARVAREEAAERRMPDRPSGDRNTGVEPGLTSRADED